MKVKLIQLKQPSFTWRQQLTVQMGMRLFASHKICMRVLCASVSSDKGAKYYAGYVTWFIVFHLIYPQTHNISRTLVGNEIVDLTDAVGASPVGAAPATSLFLT